MVKILDALHEYVPATTNKNGKIVYSPIALAGDQLTVARGRTAQVRVSSDDHSLRGFKFFAGDWHAKMNFI